MYVYAQTYVVHVCTAHEYDMPELLASERVRDSANMGGQNLQIFKLLNVMVTSFCIYGGGGGVELGNQGTGEVVVCIDSFA